MDQNGVVGPVGVVQLLHNPILTHEVTAFVEISA